MKPKTIKIIIISLILFIVNICLWNLPILYKGTAPAPAVRNLIVARNSHLSNTSVMEDKLGRNLNTELVKNNVDFLSVKINALTSQIYTKIFDIFGYSKELPIWTAIICFALINLILALLITYKFNWQTGLIFHILSLFTPVVWQGALMPGFYEFAVLFFVLGLICYLSKKNTPWYLILLSGLFFSLAILSRNAFILSVFAIGIYELFFRKSIKRVILFILPICILVLFPLASDYFSNQTLYMHKDAYSNYGHCFPDSYTYLFDKQEYISQKITSARGDVLVCLTEQEGGGSLQQNLQPMLNSAIYYLRDSIRFIVFGGPIFLFLLLIGLLKLKRDNQDLYKLSLTWLILWYLLLILTKTSNWDHFLEIYPLVLFLVSSGIYVLWQMVKDKIKHKNFWLILIILTLIAHQLIACKWMFHEEYNTSHIETTLKISDKINLLNLPLTTIIAVNQNFGVQNLNYYTNLTYIRFNSATLEKLISENKLKNALEYFGVTHLLGYDEDLNKKLKNYNLKIIDLDNLLTHD